MWPVSLIPSSWKFSRIYRCKSICANANLTSVKDWNNFAKSKKCPIDIPKAPWAYYRNAGWVDMGDWLGTFYVAPQNRKYRKFEFARKYVRTLNIKTVNQWRNYTKSDGLPEDIPTQPDRVYKNSGWVNYGDWLGTGNIAPKDMVWRSFKEARIYVHSLNLTSLEKWRTYCTKGINGMPSVRRHINWNNQRPDPKEDLAHLVQDIKRRICGIASAGFPSSSA